MTVSLDRAGFTALEEDDANCVPQVRQNFASAGSCSPQFEQNCNFIQSESYSELRIDVPV